MTVKILFYLFAALSIISAFFAITRKNPVLSAVWLVVCMCSLAVIYVLLDAFFLAAVQVIVYAGAVLMLFVFVIMLLNLRTGIIGQMRNLGIKFLGLVITVILLDQLRTAVKGAGILLHSPGKLEPGFGEAEAVGKLLFSQYVYPLEIISVLLLVAIVGALVLAGKERT
ncbi:MAG TPA: NADH-quinone oxidoreductase subunit J [archaeon]|nr:NADH-quinone oxidoreductase subunit J [archaeon]